MAGLNAGQWAALVMIGLFFVAGIGALIWAYQKGLFKNIEEAKYKMFEGEDVKHE